MNKQDLIKKIKSIDALSSDEKSELIELVNTQKRYGLVWEEKTEEVEEELREKLPVLVEVKDKFIKAKEQKQKAKQDDLFTESGETNENTAKEAPNHILIEGDNLHALTVLNYTHAGKIDVIYIDPPYNTGNNDFWYDDNFVNRDDSYRHSKWISFMNKRLRIAKRLLNENGLVYISIDDNEVAQLKMLCDEIFGEKNFIAIICQKSRHSISNDLILSENHNYLLVYSKVFEKIFAKRKNFRLSKEIDVSKFKNPDNDPKGLYKIHPVDGPGGARKGNPYYEFLGVTGYWRYSKETMQTLFENGEIVKRRNTLGRKYYLSYAEQNNLESVTTWWDDVGTTTEGTKTLKEIIPNCEFTNPKPLGLLDKILNLSTNNCKNYTILDFFAGSGTTLHATIQLNAEDGGARQCILVTNNENNIAEEVCYERNKRVIKGYTNSKGEKVEGLTNNNFRYFKTDFVGREKTQKNRRELTLLATDLLRIKEDCYEEISKNEKWIIDKNIRLFSNAVENMLIIYDEASIETAIEIIKDLDKKTKVYVFSPGQYPYTEDFEEVLDKVELCALPEAIYKAFRAILPKRKISE